MFNLLPYLPFLVPIIIVICITVLGIVFFSTREDIAIAQASSVNRAYIEELLQELLQDNTDIKTDLADIQEKVASIEKMMKDV